MNYSDYDAETLFSVGRRFLNGDCVEKDIAKAKAMLSRAAGMGHPLARIDHDDYRTVLEEMIP